VDIAIKRVRNDAPIGDAIVLENLPAKFSQHFDEEDYQSDAHGYKTSTILCDTLLTLEADTYRVVSYTTKSNKSTGVLEINDKPMTIIYPGAMGLANNAVAEDGSIGIRVPEHQFCKALLKKFRKPIISTSANISGETAPVYYKEIPQNIKDAADWIADAELEGDSTHSASQIIKLGLGGEVEIIRK
jgi:L-threonylcarbamoyladenylate synthase